MDDPNDYIDVLKASPLIAGAMGGLIRWFAKRQSIKQGLISIGTGAICAIYLSPLVLPLLEPVVGKIDPDGAETFAAFVVGLGGLQVVEFLMEKIGHAVKKDGKTNRPENPQAADGEK